MFGLFGKKYSNPALLEELRTRQDRWFVFLDKLEARMDELTTAAVPELHTLFREDGDPYKRSHGQMLMGLLGQVNQMRDKANEVREDNIISFLYGAEATLPVITSGAGRDYHNRILSFRMACINRYYIFDEKLNEAIELLRGTTGQQDLEGAYQEQLAAFERIRDKFTCRQCGGNIVIPKMFFIDTYVTCPFCHSQNTFKPSTAARMVMHNARALAEQRTAHLLKAFEDSNPRDRSLYARYLRALFNEWNSIVPDMAEENEKFYQRLLEEHTINRFK